MKLSTLLILGAGGYGAYRLLSAIDEAQKEAIGQPTYWSVAVDAANASNVPPEILGGIVRAESSWSNEPNRFSDSCGVPCIASKVCAIGLAQVLPKTAESVGISGDSLCDPVNNLIAAARYLRRLYSKYRDWHTAAIAYNWGPGNVDAWLNGDKKVYSGSVAYADKVMAGAVKYGYNEAAAGLSARPRLFALRHC